MSACVAEYAGTGLTEAQIVGHALAIATREGSTEAGTLAFWRWCQFRLVVARPVNLAADCNVSHCTRSPCFRRLEQSLRAVAEALATKKATFESEVAAVRFERRKRVRCC